MQGASDNSQKAGPQAPNETVVSRKIGRYDIVRKIGEGATGEVWFGHHPGLGIPVAVKVLSPELIARGSTVIRRFLREGHTAAQIDHPNVVRIYDADRDGKTYFMVMEYMSGGTLRDLMKEVGGILAPREALKVVMAMGKALRAAARQKIVHRDIKPDNIMFSDDGVPKLLDLGIAKEWGQPTRPDITTGAGAIGTPAYMSPEQIVDAKAIDARSDIYSLGITFFQLVTGVLPFRGESAFETMSMHVNDPLPHPTTENPVLDEPTCAVICRMTEKNPDDRYQTADQLLRHLMDIAPSSTDDDPRLTTYHFAGSTPVLDGNACRKCGTVVEASGAFCGNCGAELRSPCPECGRENDAILEFCPGCGTSVIRFHELEKLIHKAERLVQQRQWPQAVEQINESAAGGAGMNGEKGKELLGRLEALHRHAEEELGKSHTLREQVDGLVAEERYAEAFEQVEIYLEQYPHDVGAEALVPQLRRLKCARDFRDGYQGLRRLMTDGRYNDVQAALSKMEELRSELPDLESVECELAGDSGDVLVRSLAELAEEMAAWRETIASREEEALALLAQAEEAEHEKRWEQTEELLARAAEVYPEHPKCVEARERVSEAKRKIVEAHEQFEQAKEHIKEAAFERAEELFRSIRGAWPALPGLGDWTERLARTSRDFKRQVEIAADALAANDLAVSLAAYRLAQKLCPASQRVAGQIEAVVETQERARKHWRMAQDSLNAARFGEAREHHERADSLWPTCHEFSSFGVNLEVTEEGYNEALEETTASLDKKRYIAARDACARARVLCPDSRDAAALSQKVHRLHEIAKVKSAFRQRLRQRIKLGLTATAVFMLVAAAIGAGVGLVLRLWFADVL